ncbi:hypothetical protein C9374_009459 [Naegleria lovaniensis]|uniref:Uncharacterized protein n=1 Tax=Naegleria lovaniensis TaxID=51637 RepID=A0AA88H4M3_NAELO|nr:uncharacterized protein C9374_009459 [Naegleria lovaniensis]KAG2392882.1 hypothetical protein C9374_009459 [Naegleria lovaniensis]
MPKNSKSPAKTKTPRKSKSGSVRKQPLNFVMKGSDDENKNNTPFQGGGVVSSEAIPITSSNSSHDDDALNSDDVMIIHEPSSSEKLNTIDIDQQQQPEIHNDHSHTSSTTSRNNSISTPLHSSPKKRNHSSTTKQQQQHTITNFFSSPSSSSSVQKKSVDDVELLNSQAYFPTELLANSTMLSQNSTDFQGMQQEDTFSIPSLSQSSKQNTPPKLTTTLTFKQKPSPNNHSTLTSPAVTTNDTSSSMVTPKKPVKTLKMKDDTTSSKSKKKNESTKRKRSEIPHVESINSSDSSEENQQFVSTKNKNTDEIVGSVASIFLTKEQKKRKKELQVQSEHQKNQEKRKELNELFCKGSGEHPLMAFQREQKKVQKEAKKTTHAEDHDFWQGVKPITCNVTTQALKHFGNCQHVNYVNKISVECLCTTSNSNTMINIDDLLPEDDSNEISTTYENTQIIPLLNKLTSASIEQPKSSRTFEKKVHDLSTENTLATENKLPQIEKAVEILYPKSMWNTEKHRFTTEFKNLEEKKWRKAKALQEQQQKLQPIDLDAENSMESSNSNSGFERREARRENLSEDLWFVKYRPTHSKQVICRNSEANEQIHEWLESWKNMLSSSKPSLKQSKRTKKRKPKEEEARRKSKKEKEFFDAFTDDEEENDLENCLIIYGPNSGKTASVSANATELGFAELGLDASKERTSKSVTELKETTQSRGLRESHETIIVIEDADVTFKEESYSSFVNGVEKLVKTSKRPIILVADHLKSDSPLKSFCKKSICFLNEKPYLNHSIDKDTIDQHCKYLLDVTCYIYSICLCEGLSVDLERDILPVTAYFLGDLKKILLMLQFWLCHVQYHDTLMNERPSLLEVILGLNRLENYSTTITSFRHAEDDFELMDQLDLPFNNYLYNGNADSKRIPADFISLLSHADTVRNYHDQLSCNIYSTLEILSIHTLLPNKRLQSNATTIQRPSSESNNDNVSSSIIIERIIDPSMIPIIRNNGENMTLTTQNILFKFKKQCFESYMNSVIQHVIFTPKEDQLVIPSVYLLKKEHSVLLQHVFTLCNLEENRRTEGRTRRFFHYLKDLLESHIETLDKLAKPFKIKGIENSKRMDDDEDDDDV